MFNENREALFSANQVASLRIIIAALAILPFVIRKINLLFTKKWIWLLLVGALGNLLPAYLFTNAEQSISSSFTGMLNSLVPIFSLIVGISLFKHKVNMKGYIGVFVGLIGTLLLILFKDNDLSSNSTWAILMVVFATICYALSLNIIKEKLSDVSAIEITGLSLLFMLPVSLTILLIQPNNDIILSPTYSTPLILTAILAVFGTTIALILFNHLIKISSSLFASSVTYLIPFVAIMWGAFFKESIGWSSVFIILIVFGIYLVKQGNKA